MEIVALKPDRTPAFDESGILTIRKGVRNNAYRALWIARDSPRLGANARYGLRDNMSLDLILPLRRGLGRMSPFVHFTKCHRSRTLQNVTV
jgi:hypothetical protein